MRKKKKTPVRVVGVADKERRNIIEEKGQRLRNRGKEDRNRKFR